jgi:hypothetical protein
MAGSEHTNDEALLNLKDKSSRPRRTSSATGGACCTGASTSCVQSS